MACFIGSVLLFFFYTSDGERGESHLGLLSSSVKANILKHLTYKPFANCVVSFVILTLTYWKYQLPCFFFKYWKFGVSITILIFFPHTKLIYIYLTKTHSEYALKSYAVIFDGVDRFKLGTSSDIRKQSITRPKTSWLCSCSRLSSCSQLTFISSKLSRNIWSHFFINMVDRFKLRTCFDIEKKKYDQTNNYLGHMPLPYLGLQTFII